MQNQFARSDLNVHNLEPENDILLLDLKKNQCILNTNSKKNPTLQIRKNYRIIIHNNLPVFSIIVPGILNRYPGRLKVFMIS